MRQNVFRRMSSMSSMSSGKPSAISALKYYFDYKSPFSYLSKDLVLQLEKDFNVDVKWLPYQFQVATSFGLPESRSQLQLNRVKYAYLDARRFANERGLVIKGPLKVYDSNLALVVGLFAQKQGRAIFDRFSEEVYRRFFDRSLDIESLEVLQRLLVECGGSTEGLPLFISEGGRGFVELHNIKRIAETEDGVFGVPSFVLNGELFMGQDRIHWLRKRLQQLSHDTKEKTPKSRL
eukprot:GILJ01010038.1.p1 GENE.GILJ01010038.1~~GILJ01010038.1.p1  ORF type:complete len:235 (+),score=16.48 GILJ01010038.1:17-721(+)